MESPPEAGPAGAPSRLARLEHALAWCREHQVEPYSIAEVVHVSAADLARVAGDAIRIIRVDDPQGAYAQLEAELDGLRLRAFPHDSTPWLARLGGPDWPAIATAAERVEAVCSPLALAVGDLQATAMAARCSRDLGERQRAAAHLSTDHPLTAIQRLVDRLTAAYADAATVIACELHDPQAERDPTPAPAPERSAPLHRCNVPSCPGYPWSPSSSQPHPCGSQVLGRDGWVTDDRARVSTADVLTPADLVDDPVRS